MIGQYQAAAMASTELNDSLSDTIANFERIKRNLSAEAGTVRLAKLQAENQVSKLGLMIDKERRLSASLQAQVTALEDARNAETLTADEQQEKLMNLEQNLSKERIQNQSLERGNTDLKERLKTTNDAWKQALRAMESSQATIQNLNLDKSRLLSQQEKLQRRANMFDHAETLSRRVWSEATGWGSPDESVLEDAVKDYRAAKKIYELK